MNARYSYLQTRYRGVLVLDIFEGQKHGSVLLQTLNPPGVRWLICMDAIGIWLDGEHMAHGQRDRVL